jgi:DNA/RNA-binding domain of Phe-tRNA-synthetase-like protein
MGTIEQGLLEGKIKIETDEDGVCISQLRNGRIRIIALTTEKALALAEAIKEEVAAFRQEAGCGHVKS